MSIFSEPTEVLCGHRHPLKDAICTARAHDDYKPHSYEPTIGVMRYLAGTFTPAKFVTPPPGQE